MNNGIVGLTPGIGDFAAVPQGAGTWAGNRGRFVSDEFRAFGNRDGQLNWNVRAGAARMINTNPAARSSIGEIVLPGDTGMVMNVGSGFIQLNGNTSTPFAAAYNVAGKYLVAPTASANVITAAFENNTIVTNPTGVASALMGMWGVTSTALYSGDGAACTLPTGLGDFNSVPIFDAPNSGTLTGSFNNYSASCAFNAAGVTLTTRSGYVVNDASGGGAITSQYGLDVPIMILGGTQNSAIRIGRGGQTLTALPPGPGQIDVYQGTTTLNFANAQLPAIIDCTGTLSFTQSGYAFGITGLGAINIAPTIVNTLGSTVTLGHLIGSNFSPTFTANTQTVSGFQAIGWVYNPSSAVINSGVISGGSFYGLSATGTIGTGTTIALLNPILISAPTITGTLTSFVGIDIAAVTGAGTNIGIRNASSLRQQGAFIATNNVVTVSSNAGTVAVTNYLSTFTNSSAATMAITMAVTGAVDAQLAIVRIYDFSNVAETIGWTNTENSGAVAPTTSNGSTTLPLTVGFIFNGSTSKWRCVAVA